MQVNSHESNSKASKDAFCYSLTADVLQVQEQLLKQLNAERDEDIPNFKFYYDEMEKIHSNLYDGGVFVLTEESQKVDEYFGAVGTASISNFDITEKGRKYDGIC